MNKQSENELHKRITDFLCNYDNKPYLEIEEIVRFAKEYAAQERQQSYQEGKRAGMVELAEKVKKRLGDNLPNPDSDVIVDAVNNSFNEIKSILDDLLAQLTSEQNQ